MKHRTLGILGAALVVGGIVLGIGTAVASTRIGVASRPAAIQGPALGVLPRHRGPGQAGPFFGPQQRRGFPFGPGQRAPIATPSAPANPTPST